MSHNQQSQIGSSIDYYDLFVIGAGSGGLSAAKRAASYGARVAIAEHDLVGGTCVIRGCTQANIFAVGDCTNRINLTPVAIAEGRAFADTEFGNKPRAASHEGVPSAVFSNPEAATVGLTEDQAREKYGESVQCYRSKFRPLFHSLTGRDEKTLVKLVVEGNSERVLGAHMVGDHAAEVIQGMAIAINIGATKKDFDTTLGIHRHWSSRA